VRFNPVPSEADIRQEAVRLIACELERKAQETKKPEADSEQQVHFHLNFLFDVVPECISITVLALL
jgi:hypothetical protein